jgi:uncharacterized protein
MKNNLWMTLVLSGGVIFFAQSKVIAATMVQVLPTSAQANIASQVFSLEVARTQEEKRIGLMNRPSLADNQGMLFPFDTPLITPFWNRDVLIPLDLIFLRNENVVSIAPNVPSCLTDACSLYFPVNINKGNYGVFESIFETEPIPSNQTFIRLPLEIGRNLVIVDQVIELRGGRTGELGLKVGDFIKVTSVPDFSSPIGILAFSALGNCMLRRQKLKKN